ncbi:MAG: hypothetical protein K940chlam8_01182, partial [Chlamydiae bacterium]|nr:hypothetical protein [Chlamydiota bacterium]
MNTFEWIASPHLHAMFPVFLERLNRDTGKKKICVFPNAFVKSALFFEGVKKNCSFGLFEIFYLDELTFFLQTLFQKKQQKKLFTYQELVFYLEEFLENMNHNLLEKTAPLTLKRKLLPHLLQQFAKELHEAVCNPQKPLSKKKQQLVDTLLKESIFLNPFEMQFDQAQEFEIHFFGFDTFELVTMELFFRLN